MTELEAALPKSSDQLLTELQGLAIECENQIKKIREDNKREEKNLAAIKKVNKESISENQESLKRIKKAIKALSPTPPNKTSTKKTKPELKAVS